MPKTIQKSAAVSILPPGSLKKRTKRRAKTAAPTRTPDYELLPELREFTAGREYEDDDGTIRVEQVRYDVVVKVRQIPSITLAVLEGVFLGIPRSERKTLPLSGLTTYLLHSGLIRLQEDPQVEEYRDLRASALTNVYPDPAAKVRLRNWLKRCSYEAPGAHGGTEDWSTKTTPFVSDLAGGIAAETGVTKYALCAACISGELARVAPTEDDHAALMTQFDALVGEITTRLGELRKRVKNELRNAP